MFEKGSGEREFAKTFGPILLLFLTVTIASFIFAMHEYGVDITEDWLVLVIQIVIMWLGLWLYSKVDSWDSSNTKERERIILEFVRSGAPKGFNFEVLMSFLSNLTIAGLALSLSIFLKDDNLIHPIFNYFLIYSLWVFAILLILLSVMNFIFQFGKKELSNIRMFCIYSCTIIIAFAIPILAAKI